MSSAAFISVAMSASLNETPWNLPMGCPNCSRSAAYSTEVTYPKTRISAALRDVASLIGGDVGTRVYSVQAGGFDTHSGQRARHDRLMAELDDALGAFLADIRRSEAGSTASASMATPVTATASRRRERGPHSRESETWTSRTSPSRTRSVSPTSRSSRPSA